MLGSSEMKEFLAMTVESIEVLEVAVEIYGCWSVIDE
jgi:hypothetical protein